MTEDDEKLQDPTDLLVWTDKLNFAYGWQYRAYLTHDFHPSCELGHLLLRLFKAYLQIDSDLAVMESRPSQSRGRGLSGPATRELCDTSKY